MDVAAEVGAAAANAAVVAAALTVAAVAAVAAAVADVCTPHSAAPVQSTAVLTTILHFRYYSHTDEGTPVPAAAETTTDRDFLA